MMQNIATRNFSRVAVYVFFAASLIVLNYFTPRSNFYQLIICYLAAFAAYFHILYYWKEEHISEAWKISLLFRVLLLFSLPNLSDDFYRFVWDGNLSLRGINPYAYTPHDFAHSTNIHLYDLHHNIYDALNSKNYYSVYPPVCQLIFLLSALFSFGNIELNIVLLKICILLSEAGTIYFLQKVIRLKNLSSKNILLYSLNPLIIIELTGNLHFESVMIFFLVASVYMLLKGRLLFSALIFGLSAATKIWPVLLLPFFINYVGWRKSLYFAAVTCCVFFISFLPFYSPAVFSNISASLQLYFTSFEFNASLYYALKYFTIHTLHVKQLIQTVLPAMYFLVLIFLAWRYKKENILEIFLFAFFLYLFFATTVHPWYITPLILLSAVTRFRFPVFWSFCICFTYISYVHSGFAENYFIITAEYLLMFGCIFYELFMKRIKFSE